MNPVIKNIAVAVATAAIVGNFTFLWQVNARLARIEQILSPAPHVQFSVNNQPNTP